jgi:hypothetical protein
VQRPGEWVTTHNERETKRNDCISLAVSRISKKQTKAHNAQRPAPADTTPNSNPPLSHPSRLLNRCTT